MKTRPFKSLAVASAAAALPISGGTANAVESAPKADPTQAFAAPVPVWTPQWYFSAEGGALFANYSRTSFPGGLSPAFGKLGEFGEITDSSGSLSPRHNLGWFGALSIGRDIDPIWDWRLSAGYHSFDTNRRSASIDAFIEGIDFEGASSRLVTESDRFSFVTVDFDMGRKWQQGMLQGRVFAGLRGLGTYQNLKISDSEAKGIIADGDGFGIFGDTTRSTQTNGQSRFFGLGPRVGIEGFYGTNFGIVGAASAALIPGWRSSSLHQTLKGVDTVSFCDVEGCIGPFSDPFSAAFNAHRTKFTAVGNLAGSLGLGWRPTPNTMFEIGYRLDFWTNIRESFDFANDGNLSGHFAQKKDVLINEPYIKGTIRF